MLPGFKSIMRGLQWRKPRKTDKFASPYPNVTKRVLGGGWVSSFRKVLKRLRMKDLCFHSLRHTFASNLVSCFFEHIRAIGS